MKHPRRLLYLIVLLGGWATLGALPGRAQQATPSRFAFSDTTLLRDTLGLSFVRLFPLADSLGATPATLRALSIRYRAPLERFDSFDPSLGATQSEAKNELQLSVRSKQQPRRGFTSNINLFSGLLDLTNFQLVKRGVSGDLNGDMRIEVGRWLTHDLSGQVTGNLARTG